MNKNNNNNTKKKKKTTTTKFKFDRKPYYSWYATRGRPYNIEIFFIYRIL